MLAIKKDKTEYMSIAACNPEWYDIYDNELAGKVMTYYPNFDWVLNENGEPIDVINTSEEPETLEKFLNSLVDENKTFTEENQLLTDCILEMSEIIYGGE